MSILLSILAWAFLAVAVLVVGNTIATATGKGGGFVPVVVFFLLITAGLVLGNMVGAWGGAMMGAFVATAVWLVGLVGLSFGGVQ